MTSHYTYLLTADINGKQLFYAGVRTTKGQPEEDIYYLSSSRWVAELRRWGIQFRKDIIDTFSSRQEAEQHEQSIFDQFDAVANDQWLNLHSHNRPYGQVIYLRKMIHWRRLVPQLVPSDLNDRHHIITEQDRKYMVGSRLKPISIGDLSSRWRVRFLNHPDHLMYYYPSTGTRSYAPGRSDRLMTQYRSGEKKYFETDIVIPDDTTFEQIRYLQTQLLGRQFIPVLELIRDEMLLLDTDQWQQAYDALEAYRGQDEKKYSNFVIDAICRDRQDDTKIIQPKILNNYQIANRKTWAKRPIVKCPHCGNDTRAPKRHIAGCAERQQRQQDLINRGLVIQRPDWLKKILEQSEVV